MSFKFEFNNDNSSDDEFPTTDSASLSKPKAPVLRALDTFEVRSENKPQLHTLESLLSTLKDVRLTFVNHVTPGGNVVYRRELYDVKHQVMTEEESPTSQDLQQLLIEENRADLQSNVYEGGFKSWECSYDVVDKLSSLINNENANATSTSENSTHNNSGDSDNELGGVFGSNILDMGCGTALPASFLLMKKYELCNKQKMKLILSDFNYDVLRLVTLPNLLIHWCSQLPVKELHKLTTDEENTRFNNDEVMVTERLIQAFVKSLSEFGVELIFISGSWGREFNEIVELYSVDFIISSETIYSPVTLPIVAESILEIFNKQLLSQNSSSNKRKHCTAIVAAKSIYFGVGGSVIEFLTYLEKIKSEDKTNIGIDAEEINDAQLKRSLITIEYGK
ncbi:hypothetical protein PVL30_000312 [Lodderomyces elongisporus]|uniref:uncharacterized protein n=1 Tax=Lodderomyces elongisporus TaxID=36914 RepID=UPI00291D3F32|nr:uncharacterized protein PVL30_000312 [Lodderomyces elongisporus]WLF76610.1 hypothetical protein PVL30_000312 [Lodderomyces elongisporus]